jgi:uncharacterized protein involved in outer membrane biogenesis
MAIAAAGLLLVIVVAGAGALYWVFSGDGVRRALESQATSWLGEQVRIGAVAMRFVPRIAIHLTDVRVGQPAQMQLADVDVAAPLGALLRRRIEDAELIVSRSRVDMPLPFGVSGGGPPGGGRAGDGVRLVSVRSISLRDVTLVSRGRAIGVAADASLRGNELTLSRLAATSGGTSLEASGIVALEPRIDARLRVAANRLDLDELLALADAFSPSESTTARRPPVRIAARITAATARVAGVDGRNFASELQVNGNDVTLSPMSVRVFGGRYEGSLSARLGAALDATLRSRVSDLDVAQLAAFGGVPGAVSGRLSGAGTFTGSGADVAAVLRSARGSGTASIVDGTIAHLNLVRTVVVFFGRPAANAPSATDRFDRLDVAFSLSRQTLRATALALHTPDADLVGEASLVLPTQALDGRVDLSLSEALSQQAGHDLYRFTREGNRVILPATIGGTLGSPRLGIDAAAALQRGLRNEVQQRLRDLVGQLPR